MKKKLKAPHNLVTVIFMALFAFVVVFAVSSNMKEYRTLKAEEASLREEITAENEKTQKLYDEQEYYTSDEYIESVARNQLGLIKPNEIVFIKN